MTTKTPRQVFIPVKRLTKTEIDIQLIEACVLEKWNPIALGCRINEQGQKTCVLCQVYYHQNCVDCPICIKSGNRLCRNTPFDAFIWSAKNSVYEFDAIEAEIEFLIGLLPETHQWRKNNDQHQPSFQTECNEARQELNNQRSQPMNDHEFELTTTEKVLFWLFAAFATGFCTWLVVKIFQLSWS